MSVNPNHLDSYSATDQYQDVFQMHNEYIEDLT